MLMYRVPFFHQPNEQALRFLDLWLVSAYIRSFWQCLGRLPVGPSSNIFVAGADIDRGTWVSVAPDGTVVPADRLF